MVCTPAQTSEIHSFLSESGSLRVQRQSRALYDDAEAMFYTIRKKTFNLWVISLITLVSYFLRIKHENRVYSFKNAITNTFNESDQVKLSYRAYILYRFLDN